MDWRVLEIIKFIDLKPAQVYTAFKLCEFNNRSEIQTLNLNQRKQALETDILFTDDFEEVKQQQSHFNQIVYIPSGLNKRISSARLSGYKMDSYTLAYSNTDVRYIVPKKTSLKTIFKMTPRGVLMSRIRKHIILLIEQIGFKFILPSAFIYTKQQCKNLISEVSNSLDSKIINTCLFTGTQGLSRRLTLQLQDQQKNYYYAKISTNEYSKEKIKTELSVLEKISTLRFTKTKYPKILSKGSNNHTLWFTQSSFEDNGYNHPKEISLLHISFLNDLASNAGKIQILKDHKVYKNILTHIDLINHQSKESIITKLQEFKNKELKLVHSHGDFTSWNLKLNSKELFIYDWEAYRENQIPLFDLFHYVVQEGILIKKQSVPEIYQEIRNTLTRFEDDLYFNGSEQELDLFLLLYILDARIEYTKLLKEDVPEFEQVEWQDRIRSEFISFLEKKLSKIST